MLLYNAGVAKHSFRERLFGYARNCKPEITPMEFVFDNKWGLLFMPRKWHITRTILFVRQGIRHSAFGIHHNIHIPVIITQNGYKRQLCGLIEIRVRAGFAISGITVLIDFMCEYTARKVFNLASVVAFLWCLMAVGVSMIVDVLL